MKINATTTKKLLFAIVTILGLSLGAARVASAHDGQWDTRHHYYRDNYGYWDDHDHYRHYVSYNKHHGYWDDRAGFRVFINVD